MDNSKNTFGIITFIVILILFVVGGFFSMRYFTTHKDGKKDEKKEEVIDLRMDKTRDYLYYSAREDIIASEEMHKEEVIFNFESLEALNKTLKEETEKIFDSIKYEKDMDLPKTDSEGNEIEYHKNEEGIYSINARDYEDAKYNDYISLVVKDYSYDIINGYVATAVKAYVVDIKTGKVITDEELMKKYEITLDQIKEKVKERLTNLQVLGEGEVVIDIDGTLNNITTKALSINKVGKLTLSFIVKSDQNTYNDSIDLN